MESYERIMGLVEDVRDILDLHEIKGMKLTHKDRVFQRMKASHPGVTIKSGPNKGKKRKATAKERHAHAQAAMSGITKGHASATGHNPFFHHKAGKRLGPTDKTVARNPTDRVPGKQKKVWQCRCHSYHCLCKGKGEKNKGHIKHVQIDRGYKDKYNRKYRKWRSKPSIKKQFAPGGKRGIRKKRGKNVTHPDKD